MTGRSLAATRLRAGVDQRWPRVRALILRLARERRRSLRLVDVACGRGELLLRAARYARAHGFVAIEARGVDRRSSSIRYAQAHAAAERDPAIGLVFQCLPPGRVLAEEAAFPADLVLCDGEVRAHPGAAAALARAGRCVVALDRARGGGVPG